MQRYAGAMIEAPANYNAAETAETALLAQLAHGDAMLGTITPILRHLLANEDHSVFGDDIIASMRGMADSLARQLLDALAAADGAASDAEHEADDIAALAAALTDIPGFLGHLHALALEWRLTQRLQARLALDPVLSPLLQALVASGEGATSSLAMNFLAAQARFCQAQKRMELALNELPGDLLHGALLALRALAGEDEEADRRAAAAEAAIRGAYDEARSRLGLVARLVTGMGGGAIAALAIAHAGVAIFLTALSLASGQDRDLCALTTNESQLARFALALRAAGLKTPAVEEQFLALHPDAGVPDGFDRLGPDRAAAILSGATAPGGV